MKHDKVSLMALCIVIAAMTVSCDLTGMVDALGGGKSGYALVSFAKGTGIKTIAPSLDMAASTYDVTFSRTGYASVAETRRSASYLSSTPVELTVGSWNLLVTAYNAAGTAIGSGSSGVIISASRTTAASVTVSMLSGNGTLILSADWSTLSGISSPTLTGTLTPTSGNPTNLSFSLGSGSATCTNSAIASGSYTLSLVLSDGGTVIARAVDAVLIIAGQTATGSVSFAKSSSTTGSVTVTIVVDLPTGTTYAFSPASGSTITAGSSISATPSSTIDSYAWYLDGVLDSANTTATYATSSSLSAGTYYLTVVGRRGNFLSSGSTSFVIQ